MSFEQADRVCYAEYTKSKTHHLLRALRPTNINRLNHFRIFVLVTVVRRQGVPLSGFHFFVRGTDVHYSTGRFVNGPQSEFQQRLPLNRSSSSAATASRFAPAVRLVPSLSDPRLRKHTPS